MATTGIAPMDTNHRLDAYFAGLCESLVASLRTVFLEQLEAEREDMRHSFEAELNRVHLEYKDYIERMQHHGAAADHTNVPVVVESAPKPRMPPTPQCENRILGVTPTMPARQTKHQELPLQQIHNTQNQTQDFVVVEKHFLPATRPAMQPAQQVVQAAAQQVVQVLHGEAVAQTGAATHRQMPQVIQPVQQVQHVLQTHRAAPVPPQSAPQAAAHCNGFLPMAHPNSHQNSHAPPPLAQWGQNSPQQPCQPFFPFHVEPGLKQQKEASGTPAQPHSPTLQHHMPADHASSHGTLPSTAPAVNAQSPTHAQSPPPPAPPPPGPPATVPNGLGGIHEQAMANAVHQPNYQL